MNKRQKEKAGLRGKFFLLAVISYVIGAGIDAIVPFDWGPLFVQRIFQFFSICFCYIAFMLPDWIKNKLVKT